MANQALGPVDMTGGLEVAGGPPFRRMQEVTLSPASASQKLGSDGKAFYKVTRMMSLSLPLPPTVSIK